MGITEGMPVGENVMLRLQAGAGVALAGVQPELQVTPADFQVWWGHHDDLFRLYQARVAADVLTPLPEGRETWGGRLRLGLGIGARSIEGRKPLTQVFGYGTVEKTGDENLFLGAGVEAGILPLLNLSLAHHTSHDQERFFIEGKARAGETALVIGLRFTDNVFERIAQAL
ncbi:MAG: hypothetical protein Q7T11_03750 [Deltaproteobacteria bacterium]|nr:hypothetical protein [Deltaproteobacteria bacterium]